jgi:hypothetical protein
MKNSRKQSLLKQINLEGNLDYVDKEGNVVKTEKIEWNKCEICGDKSIGDLCGRKKCGNEWLSRYFP